MNLNVVDITKELKELKEGQAFCWLGDFYMVLDEFDNEKEKVLCADIATGTTIYIDYDTLVTPYEAEVTLK